MSDTSKVAVIAGYGSGISAAVARRFGAEGYKLALLARTQSRLDAAAAELSKTGITAKGYPTDLTDAAAVRSTVAAVHNDLGSISVLFWNPYGKRVGLLELTPEELVAEFNLTVTGLHTAVQVAHEDLKTTKGAVLVTGGGLTLESDQAVDMCLQWDAVSWTVPKVAQRKLVHLLNKGLAEDGIYAVEVTVLGAVRGTPADVQGTSELTADSIAVEFWALHQRRDPSVWYVCKG